MHSCQRHSTTVAIEPGKTVEVDIEHVQAAALTGRQSDKRTPMRPPEFSNCRWIRRRVLEAMRGRRLFIGQAGKHGEDFAFKQNRPHSKSRVQRVLDFADFFAPIRPLSSSNQQTQKLMTFVLLRGLNSTAKKPSRDLSTAQPHDLVHSFI